MELKEFIKIALAEITNAIIEAQTHPPGSPSVSQSVIPPLKLAALGRGAVGIAPNVSKSILSLLCYECGRHDPNVTV